MPPPVSHYKYVLAFCRENSHMFYIKDILAYIRYFQWLKDNGGGIVSSLRRSKQHALHCPRYSHYRVPFQDVDFRVFKKHREIKTRILEIIIS